jgi:RNA polymerase sigma factor (sigma-70 family)
MNLNEAYTNWATNPTSENYEAFGKDLLIYVKGRIRKVRGVAREIRDEMPINVVIRVLSELSQYNPARSPFTVWVNYKIDHVAADMTTNAFDKREYELLEGHEAPDPYRGIEAKILLKRLMETLSVEEQRLVHLKLEGYGGEEIAAELGVSHEVVRKRWERIQKKLQKAAQ